MKTRIDQLLLIVVLVSLVFGQLTRWQLGSKLGIYLHDPAILILLLINANTILAWLKPNSLKLFYRKYRLESLFILWLIISLVATLISTPSLTPVLYSTRLAAYVAFVALVFSLDSFKNIINSRPFLITGTVLLLLGLVFLAMIPDTQFLAVFGWDDHFYRLVGTWFDPNFTGLGLVLTLIAALGFLANSRPIWTTILLLLPFVTALILTFSRSTYLSFVLPILSIAAGSLLIKRHLTKLTKIAVTVLLVFLALLLLVPKPAGEGGNLMRTYSLESRVSNDQQLINLNHYRLLVGGNLFSGAPSDAQQISHSNLPNNIFVLILSGTGVIGLGLFVMTAIKWGIYFYRVNLMALASLTAVLIHSMFNNSLLQPFIFLMFFGLLLEMLRSSQVKA